MPTKFIDIYNRAVFKFIDYSFLTGNPEAKKTAMEKYLLSAISDFQYVCILDISNYDLELEQFNIELDNETSEILSLGVAYYWLRSQLLNSQLLKNKIHNSDYTSYSPANLLKEIQNLKENIEKEYKSKINNYSYRHSSFDTLKV